MENTQVPSAITRKQWEEACKALGLVKMDFHQLVFRPLDVHERAEFLVDGTQTQYFVCEVTWMDHGYDQDRQLVLAPVTKKILVNIGSTKKERDQE